MAVENESSITEINILPDGRIYLFGASQQVLEVLATVPLNDQALKSRLDCLGATKTSQTVALNKVCDIRNSGTPKN